MKIRLCIPIRFMYSLLAILFVFCSQFASVISAAEKQESADTTKDSFNLILPYTDVTVGPGQEVTMDTEVVNRTKNPVQVGLKIEGVPQGWEVGFSSRYPSFPVRSVMVQGEKSTTLEFKSKIPEKTKPGNYEIKVIAKEENAPTSQTESITVRVTSKKVETGGLRLTSQYPVLSGPTGQTFKFTVDLKNETNKPLTTALVAQAPTGWSVRFKPQFGDTQITSIALKENSTETLSIEVDSPAKAEASEYPLTVRARSGPYEATANLKLTLKGSYDLQIIPQTGTFNTSVVAGKRSPLVFFVGNAGSATIRNLSFITKKPDRWTVEFKPDKIDQLDPGSGGVREVRMEIQPPQRAIAGDYLLSLTANSPDTSKSADFRVTVSTPTFWGWIGALIVAVVVIALALVFIRLGRR